MKVCTAVRASISVPVYFSAVFLDSTGKRVFGKREKDSFIDVYVDGGLLANYPLTIFDSQYNKMETLGLKLDRPEQIDYRKTSSGVAPYQIDGLKTYISAFYNIILENLNKLPDSTEMLRTIYISTGNINPRVRKISNYNKQLLYANGKDAVEAFLARGESSKD
jgi:NTE family protein